MLTSDEEISDWLDFGTVPLSKVRTKVEKSNNSILQLPPGINCFENEESETVNSEHERDTGIPK